MRPINALISVAILFTGCDSLYFDLADESRIAMSKLSPNMTKQEVISIMGSKTVDTIGGARVPSPFRTSMYQRSGDVIEIYFYYTQFIWADGRVTDDELTPIVFINGKLDSWGWESWVEKAKRYDINVNYKLN